MVKMRSTGFLEGLFVETLLKWEFPVVPFDVYGLFLVAQKGIYFIKARKVTGQTDFQQS